jgi:hypothetical protein
MANKRYKVTKEQLERVVENFVMESAMNTGKSPVKNMIPKQGPEAKKYVKNKISGGMVDQSENIPSVSTMKKKLSQAPEAKKYMAKGKTSYMSKPKTVKENIGELALSGAIPIAQFLAAVGLAGTAAFAAWRMAFGEDNPIPKDVKQMESELVEKSPQEKKTFFQKLLGK